MNRKSQITLFIIVGLILLLVLALFFYMSTLRVEEFEPELEETVMIQDAQSLHNYIEQCLKDVSKESIEEIALQGGSFDPVQWRYVNEIKVNMLCYAEGDNPCVQTLTTVDDIELELARRISFNLDQCIDLAELEKQGYTIETGEKTINPIITNENVLINMYYTVQLSTEGASFTADEFSTEVKAPLGLLFRNALFIMNEENTAGFFAHMDFMQQHTGIVVEKEKPYPSVIYRLTKDDLVFQFAMQGVDTVSQSGRVNFAASENRYGCCYIEGDYCYANAPKDICELKQGVYEPGLCTCPVLDMGTETLCEGESCDPCVNTYNYVTKEYDNPSKQHGESWCVYDSVVGQGLDYVGSRHYMHYCIDGVEYVEPCRDYREELCTEESDVYGQSTAVCRVNRWQDCSRCDTQECCEDTDLRDCAWKDWLDTAGQCTPAVPPGFRHWEYIGMEICNYANEQKYCEGFSCPNKWIDDSAIYCYSQGDCGNYRNIVDELTMFGHFNSDLADNVRDYVYHDDGNIEYGHISVVELPLDTRDLAELDVSPFEISTDNLIDLISAAYQYVDRLSSLSISDFLNPFTEKPKLEILDVSFCSVWQAPHKKSDCKLCTDDPLRPCTEYKCKSLGIKCVYKEEEGTPTCSPSTTEDTTAPEIYFDESALTAGHNAEEKPLLVHETEFDGYSITPDLHPYKPFTLGVITNEKTICRIDATPNIPYVNLPLFTFGDYTYGTSHNLTLRIPPRVEVPEKILDVLNVSTLTELISALEKPQELLEEYQERFAFVFSVYKLVTGNDLTELLEPVVEQVLNFISIAGDMFPFYEELINTLLSKFESGGYYLFVKCFDEAGNMNSKDFYIEMTIGDLSNDTEPPAVVETFPENNGLVAADLIEEDIFLYLNEPADCNYDFEDKTFEQMQYEFDCVSSPYDLYPVAGGTYPCTAALTLADSTTIYVRCMDHPPQEEKYELLIERDTEYALEGVDISRYANISSDTISVSSNMIRFGNNLVFHVEQDDLNLVFYQEEEQECSLICEDEEIEIKDCVPIDDLDLGFYQCEAEFSLETEEYERNMSFLLNFENQTINNTASGIELNETLIIDYTLLDAMTTVYYNETQLYFSLNIPDEFECVYNTTPAELSCLQNTNTTCTGLFDLESQQSFNITCTNITEIGIPNLGQLYQYNITCANADPLQRNTNTESYVYTIQKSEPLEILSITPYDEEVEEDIALTVMVSESEGTECSYTSSMTMSYLRMKLIAKEIYHAPLKGLEKGSHHYYARCTDIYGNTAEADTVFYVI